VGWYHSHTRTEIFLSEADLGSITVISSWQVAVVMKPHTFQPGARRHLLPRGRRSIHASAPYQEITIEGLPMRPVPAGQAMECRNPWAANGDQTGA